MGVIDPARITGARAADQRRDWEEAEGLLRRALEIAREQEAKFPELRAATSLARLLRDQERRDGARALLQPLDSWFSEGFDTADLKDAQALLDEAINAYLAGDTTTGKAILRDLVNAMVGFEGLAAAVDKSSKSLQDLFEGAATTRSSPGNATAQSTPPTSGCWRRAPSRTRRRKRAAQHESGRSPERPRGMGSGDDLPFATRRS
jgi:tetratricopeptide (TPR) repeat protein